MREGNLEAPTRHPLDWQNPSFTDRTSIEKELERVFDICHGCRRCVSLCNAFPTLFDLIDESKTGEVDGVDKKDYGKVVDECYMCDLCYMAKCPYVPPHPWNVDFPHLMLRAKAAQFQGGEVHRAEKILSSTTALGKLASIPVVVHIANASTQAKPTRKLMQKVLHVHPEAALPIYHSKTLRRTAKKSAPHPVKDGALTPGKVAVFASCFINYNDPQIGHDLLAVLDHNQIPYVFAEKEVCCGMPKFEVGDLEGVRKLKEINVPRLAKLAREGFAIMSPIPSCTLMFKQELPLMYPGDEDVDVVKRAMYDPFEYLIERNRDGLLKTDFVRPLGKVSYHIACHLRVQNVGQKTREALSMIPGIELNTIERCSGHAGTWGVRDKHFEMAIKIGRPVFKQMNSTAPDYISSDCALAAMHIEQGIARTQQPVQPTQPATGNSSGNAPGNSSGNAAGNSSGNAPGNAVASSTATPAKVAAKAHPLSLFRIAYGLGEDGRPVDPST